MEKSIMEGIILVAMAIALVVVLWLRPEGWIHAGLAFCLAWTARAWLGGSR